MLPNELLNHDKQCMEELVKLEGKLTPKVRQEILEDLTGDLHKILRKREHILEVIEKLSGYVKEIMALLDEECFSEDFVEKWNELYEYMEGRIGVCRIAVGDSLAEEYIGPFYHSLSFDMRELLGHVKDVRKITEQLQEAAAVLEGTSFASQDDRCCRFGKE